MRFYVIKYFLIVLIFGWSNYGLAQKNTTPSLLKDSAFNNAHVGIYVYNLSSNKVIDSYQSHKYFIPSSNVKIATCYAAMQLLGDSLLGLLYSKESDTTLTIIGTGDPTFLHKDFKQQLVFNFLKEIKTKNIFLGEMYNTDVEMLKSYGKGWAWEDYQEAFMPARSFFPIYGNLATFSLQNDTIKVVPKFFQKNTYQWYEKIKTFKIEKEKNNNNFYVRNYGKVSAADNQIPFNLHDELPTNSLTPILLGDTLGKNIGISLIPYKNINNANSYQKLYSQPTDSLLQPMMYNSDNFFAEQTLLMLSFKQLGYFSDEQIIDTLLKSIYKNLPQKPRWVDGSGLSRYNLFTPQTFVHIITNMLQQNSWQRVSTIFPTGNQGTLKGYYKNYVNRFYAKTGSMSNNYALSGFLKTNKQQTIVFSILVNNHAGTTATAVKQAIEKYLTQIIEKN